jgi:hypothetical protein
MGRQVYGTSRPRTPVGGGQKAKKSKENSLVPVAGARWKKPARGFDRGPVVREAISSGDS